MANNTQALENGFTKARHLIDEYKRKALIRGGQALVESFLKRFRTYRGSIGLTGNTFSGTAVGCYMRGQLYAVISSQDMVGEPLRKKLHKGETVINFVDINGRLRRKFTATVNTTDETSYDTAMRFLQSHRPSGKDGLIMVSGSEYAKYIESELHGEVITGTYHNAPNICMAQFNHL